MGAYVVVAEEMSLSWEPKPLDLDPLSLTLLAMDESPAAELSLKLERRILRVILWRNARPDQTRIHKLRKESNSTLNPSLSVCLKTLKALE